MGFFAYAYIVIAHAVFAYDAYLELTSKVTLTDRVFNLNLPNWPIYVMSLVGFNLCFWVGSPELSGVFLAAWLLGHFSL